MEDVGGGAQYEVALEKFVNVRNKVIDHFLLKKEKETENVLVWFFGVRVEK